MFLGQRRWGCGMRMGSRRNTVTRIALLVFSFSIIPPSTATPQYIPGISLSSHHLPAIWTVFPPASFCCLYSPIFFPSFLFRTPSCFSQGSSLDLKTFKYLPFCSTCIQLLSPVFFHIGVAITLYSLYSQIQSWWYTKESTYIKKTFSWLML